MKLVKFSVLLALILSVNLIQAQTQSTISIKTITIQNGDTVVTERSYNSDGNGINFNDSIFNSDDHFMFFNKNYEIDTNFEENFNAIISREMKDFLKNFNYSPFETQENDIEFFNKTFPFDFDSTFSNEYDYQMIPQQDSSVTSPNKNYFRPLKPKGNFEIITENIIIPDKDCVIDFATSASTEDGSLKIVFQLDQKNYTKLLLKDEKQKDIYKEKIPKSSGVYTRLLDLKVYSPGTYFIEVRQGKKVSISKILLKKTEY